MKLGTSNIKARIGSGSIFRRFVVPGTTPETPETFALYDPVGEWADWVSSPPSIVGGGTLAAPAYTAALAGTVYDVVEDYGADPTGETDSTAAIQAAITACGVAGGGTVYLPAGTYTVWPTTAYVLGEPVPRCFNLYYSNVVIEGAGPTQTIINHRAPGGADPADPIYARGFTFTTLGTPRALENITIRGLRGTGNAPINADAGLYAGEGHETGWDTTHAFIKVFTNYTVTGIIFEFLELDNYRGEMLYCGGTGLGTFTIRKCLIRDCNASAVSMGGTLLQEDTYTYKVLQGTENFCRDGESMIYRRNVCLPNKDLPGDLLIGASGVVYHGYDTASLLVEDNTFGYGYTGAVFVSEFGSNVTIQDNEFNDGVGVNVLNQGQYEAYTDPSEYHFADWIIQRNTFNAVTRNISCAMQSIDLSSFEGILIDSNTTTHTGAFTVGTFISFLYFDDPWTVSNNTIAGGLPIQGHSGPRATYTNNTLVGGELTSGTTFGNADDTQTPLQIAPAWPKVNITQIGPLYSRPVEIPPSVVALFPDDYTIEIRRDGANNIYRGAEILPDPTWNSLTRGYMIFKGAVLVLQKNNATGLMDFVSFTPRDDDPEVAAVYANEGPVLKFFGKSEQDIIPPTPFSYNTYSGVAIGDTVTLNLNGNVTLTHVPGVLEMSTGVDYVSSGTVALSATRAADGTLEVTIP